MAWMRITAAGLLAAAGICAGAGSAPALASTVTISGTAKAGTTPDSNDANASVNATLSGGVASGSLSTYGNEGGFLAPGGTFEGKVTCMVVSGARVTVGAFGIATREAPGGSEETLPGKYAQLLTVEFGSFPNTVVEGGSPFPDSFGGLGPRFEGVSASAAPKCSKGSFKDQHLPTGGGVIDLSPVISTPKSGHVSHGKVTLTGTGQADQGIELLETADVHPIESGDETTASSKGKWSISLSGLAPGTYDFAVSDGAPTHSNVVEIKVV